MPTRILLLLLLGNLVACQPIIIISINDVYRIEGVDGGKRGGLPKVATLRNELDADLLLHAGDFLYPALLSRAYKGEQMIDVMNSLDGAPGVFDPSMFVVFGNHEFDADEMEDMPTLQARISESEFTWFDSNLKFVDEFYTPAVSARLAATRLVEIRGMKIGLFGLSGNYKHPEYVETFLPTIEIAANLTRQLREEQNADFVIALTHLSLDEDRAILEVLGEAGPDMIAGGHEHARLVAIDAGTGRGIYKADAEARTASVFELNSKTAELQHRFVLMNESIESDPLVKARVDGWLTRHEEEFCTAQGLQGSQGCLSRVLAIAGTDLIAEELEIRMYETNFGNYVLDLALMAFADEQADFAVMNSGGLRLNQNISAGGAITQRHIEELIAYPTTLFLVEVTGETIISMLNHSVDRWSGNGWFLQVSGIRFTQDPESESVSDVRLENGTPIDVAAKYRMVVNDYLLNPRYDQDGYTMLSADMTISNRVVDLRDMLLDHLNSHAEIAPTLSGRICNPDYRPENCAIR